ncbi:unnamed protein product, partial [Lymnaea stagnalis]
LINHVTLSSLCCVLGIVGNVINIRVFVKQGLAKSINTSFFAMAVSDILELLTQLVHNLCLNPYLVLLDPNVNFVDIQYLFAGCQSIIFVRITGWITAYVTAERCLSIAVPLKIKEIVTPGRTAAILVFIYAFNIATAIPLYFWAYIAWNFYPEQNRTKLGLTFRNNKLEIGVLNSNLHSSLITTAFLLVVLFTSILVYALRKQSKWRRKTASKAVKTEALSSRHRKTVVMVVVVAAVLIVCYTPAITCSVATAITDDFSFAGKQANVYHAAWSFAFLLHSVNSSITILLYYKTSTRFRQSLQEMFGGQKTKS